MTLHHRFDGLFLEVGENGHISPASQSAIDQAQSGLTRLMGYAQSRIDDKGRTVWNTHHVSMQLLQGHLDEVGAEIRRDAGLVRADDFAPGLGMFNPRDLTHKMRRVLEEKRPPLNGRLAFDVNTEVPPGALKYEQYRTYTAGEASVYRGGNASDVGEIELANAFFTAPVVYFISSFSVNWLESLRINMTGLNTQLLKMRGAVRALGEIENRLIWEGSEAWGVYGVLNHPYVDKLVSSLDFGSATAEQMSSALHQWANYAEEQSGSTFQPDTMVIAPKLYNHIANKKFGSGDPETVLERFQKSNPHISRILKARELNDAGPGGDGQHVIEFHRRGAGPADRSAELVQVMGPTILPAERRALSTKTFVVSGFGGLNQHEVGDTLVGVGARTL